MRITIELRRPARRTVALLLGVLLLTAPAVTLAADELFPDVPSGHPFHDDIGAIADAGITAGFGDGNYHPGDPVTRQAMAAFMHRGFGRVGLAIGAAPTNPSVAVGAASYVSASVPVRQLAISVPGANSAFSPTQLVHLQGRVTFSTSMSNSAKGCPCDFQAIIRDTTDNSLSVPQLQTFESAFGGLHWYGFDVEALFVAPPSTRTYQLEVWLTDRANADNAASFALDASSSLGAMTFPFGPAGTDAL